MTKTKSQKMRKRANKQTKKKIIPLLLKENNNGGGFNFLNGNSLNLNFKKQRKLQRMAMKERTVPIAKGYKIATTPAAIVTGQNFTTVSHTEYITDITGTSAFEGEAMVINPGNGILFPWLSTIAQRYQSYLFDVLEFLYVTTSPTTAGGSVIMTVDYDSNSTLPASKVEALSMESAVRVQPWDNIIHTSKRHNLRKRSSYYVRNGTDDVVDSELYDVGTFMIMTEGLPTEFVNGSVGELHVRYSVRLETMILTNATASVTGASAYVAGHNDLSGGNLDYSRPYRLAGPGDILSGLNSVNPPDAPFAMFGSTVLVTNQGNTGFGVDAITFFQPGTYIITIYLVVQNAGPAELGPNPTDFGWYSIGGSADSTLIKQTTFRQSLTATAVSNPNSVTIVFKASGDSTGAVASQFGFGWRTATGTGVQAGEMAAAIYISPWNTNTGLGPSFLFAQTRDLSRGWKGNKLHRTLRQPKIQGPGIKLAEQLSGITVQKADYPAPLPEHPYTIDEMLALEDEVTQLRGRLNQLKLERDKADLGPRLVRTQIRSSGAERPPCD